MSDDKPPLSDDFNRSGMRLYGLVSSATIGIAAGIFCAGMAMAPGAHGGWALGAVFGLAAGAGGAFETWRALRAQIRAQMDDRKPDDPAP